MKRPVFLHTRATFHDKHVRSKHIQKYIPCNTKLRVQNWVFWSNSVMDLTRIWQWFGPGCFCRVWSGFSVFWSVGTWHSNADFGRVYFGSLASFSIVLDPKPEPVSLRPELSAVPGSVMSVCQASRITKQSPSPSPTIIPATRPQPQWRT